MNDLDRIDRAILFVIQQDGRMPVAKLAERVRLSETPCARCLKRLESDGYIDCYRAMLSRKGLGLGVIAFAMVRFSVHDCVLSDRFEREIQGIERIVAYHSITTCRARRIICCRWSCAISTNTASSRAMCCAR